jgi:hypothetical protein
MSDQLVSTRARILEGGSISDDDDTEEIFDAPLYDDGLDDTEDDKEE